MARWGRPSLQGGCNSAMALDIKALMGKLSEPCNRSLNQAVALTLGRTNFNVEIEHWLAKLLEIPDGDLTKILPRYEIDAGRFSKDVNRAIDRFKTGNGRAPGLSPNIVTLVREAWLSASIDLSAPSGNIFASNFTSSITTDTLTMLSGGNIGSFFLPLDLTVVSGRGEITALVFRFLSASCSSPT